MTFLAYGLSAGLSLALPLLVVAAPETGRPVLVVAAPWSQPAVLLDLVGRADGALLRGTAVPWIAVAVSDRPDFASDLRRAGAWMILDAARITGCLPAARA